MHVIIFRLCAATAFIVILAVLLGACAKPDNRNMWTEFFKEEKAP